MLNKIVSKVWNVGSLLCNYVREKEGEPRFSLQLSQLEKREKTSFLYWKVGKMGQTCHLDTKEMEFVWVNFGHIDSLRLLHQLDTT